MGLLETIEGLVSRLTIACVNYRVNPSVREEGLGPDSSGQFSDGSISAAANF